VNPAGIQFNSPGQALRAAHGLSVKNPYPAINCLKLYHATPSFDVLNAPAGFPAVRTLRGRSQAIKSRAWKKDILVVLKLH
jgi:hypothetical protein